MATKDEPRKGRPPEITRSPDESRYKIVETRYEKGRTRWNVIDRVTRLPKTLTLVQDEELPEIDLDS